MQSQTQQLSSKRVLRLTETHTCVICGVTEECKDEINPGTCDFRVSTNAHGKCQGQLTLKEKIAFYGTGDIYIVPRAECSGCGDGFASNTYCSVCVDNAKIQPMESNP